MNKVTKTYNLLMEGFNTEQKAIWQNKLKQYPHFCNVDTPDLPLESKKVDTSKKVIKESARRHVRRIRK